MKYLTEYRVIMDRPTTILALKEALVEEWEACPQETIRKLIRSMRNRIACVKKAYGGNTRSQIKGSVREKNMENIEDAETKLNQGKRYHIKKYLAEYTVTSNLHGLKYIGEKERTSIERYFWFIAFACCVLLCAVLIRKVYIKWDRMPVIVSFDENTTPVWQIPFPAVTVCFETKSAQRRFNISKYYNIHFNKSAYADLPEDERHMYEDTCMLCNYPQLMAPVYGRNVSNGKEVVRNIKEVAPTMNEFFNRCVWRGKTMSCFKLFSRILTEDGLCYTFNILGAQELFRLENMHKEYMHLESSKSSQSWSNENGYGPSALMETYPHRGLGYGIESGLTITFTVDKDDLDYVCKGAVQGYKILLHDPAKLPRSNQQFYRIPLSQEVNLALTPQVMTTSDGLKSYKSSQRKCYFQNDRYLRYFKIYSQNNCETECLTNYTYARCGCVHFGMPHAPNMPVCSKIFDRKCLRKARLDLITAGIQSEKNTGQDDTLEQLDTVVSQCKCLPGCSSIKYKAEVSQAYFDIEAYNKAHLLHFGENHDSKYSRVNIFFDVSQFIASSRSELYGLSDFLANCGGLLGLCMGFSILSVVEIIYFLTIRVIIWRKRNSKKIINIRE